MKELQIDPNPPYGKKGAFRKLTITVPQEIYERLVKESARRKIAAEPNQLLSALLREAVVEYLDRMEGCIRTTERAISSGSIGRRRGPA